MHPTTKRFTATHEWLLPDGELMIMGITEHAQALLGDLVYIELPRVGTQVTQGAPLGVVESVKAAADFYAPISGEVVAVNAAVQDNVALVNLSPEQDGWLVKLLPSHANEFTTLLETAQYQQLTELQP